MMSPSPRNLPWLLRLLALISVGCFLAGCATTDQQQRWQVEEANRSVNKDASGELSPALEAANVVGGFLNSGAGFHGSF